MQKGRVGHSGGPPSVSLPATGARLLTVDSAYLVAVSELATNTLVSWAGDGVRTSSPFDFSRSLSLAWTSNGSPEAWAFGSRNSSSEDRYSGLRSMLPFSMAGWEISRVARSSCRLTVYPAFSRTWAYISATIWFSANAPDTPTVMVPLLFAGGDPPGLVPPVLVPPPPDEHAASTTASDSTVAPRANLRPFRMGSPPLLTSRRPRWPPKETLNPIST